MEIKQAIEILQKAVKQGGTFGFVEDFKTAANLEIEALNRRPAPENKSLTCEECAYEPHAPSEVHCIGCARMYGDHYAPKPEQEDDHA